MAAPLSFSHVLRQQDYWAALYRRTWKGSAISSFLNPLLYVLAMGVVLGGFIAGDPDRLEGAPTYLAFVAPGLLVAQAMQQAVAEATWPVLGAVKWDRTYYAMNATPLRAVDLVNGHLSFIVFRVATTALVFALVLAPFGVYASFAGAVLAFAMTVLTGLALALPVYAYAVGIESEASFSLIFRLGVMPQFLFSGAFFPIANLSPVLEALARWTPLYQGVDLARMATLGTWAWGPALVHLAYLAVLVVGGHVIATRRLTKRLAL